MFGNRVKSAGSPTAKRPRPRERGFGNRVESTSCKTRSNSQNNGNRFDYRVESASCQTSDQPKGYFTWFDYRVESVGRQTGDGCFDPSAVFDYRVESVGRQTDAGEPADQMPDRTSEPDDKTSVFLFQRPRTGFPVRCGSPQALIPVPTTVQLALARRTYVTPSVAYAGNSNPLCHV